MNFQVINNIRAISIFSLFASIENQKIIEPLKYLPKKEFLEYHLDTIFLK
jgi:hypothetical protein